MQDLPHHVLYHVFMAHQSTEGLIPFPHHAVMGMRNRDKRCKCGHLGMVHYDYEGCCTAGPCACQDFVLADGA